MKKLFLYVLMVMVSIPSAIVGNVYEPLTQSNSAFYTYLACNALIVGAASGIGRYMIIKKELGEGWETYRYESAEECVSFQTLEATLFGVIAGIVFGTLGYAVSSGIESRYAVATPSVLGLGVGFVMMLISNGKDHIKIGGAAVLTVVLGQYIGLLAGSQVARKFS